MQLLADALPQPVTDWLAKLGQEYGRVTLRRVTLLEVDNPQQLAELTQSKRIRECFRRPLSPPAVVVKPSWAQSLVHRLVLRGFQPRLELPSDSYPPAHPQSNPQFDQPTLAPLYLSARLTHALADLIPASFRPPYSILLDLERQMTEHDREVANDLVQDGVKQVNHERRRTNVDSPSLVHDSVQRALDTHTPLEIVYYSPSNGETTTRLVEPVRLEAHEGSTYLVAYCHLRRDERTFRLDRILQLTLRAADSAPVARRRTTLNK